MAPCTHPGLKGLFCLKAKNGLGRFAPSALPHYNHVLCDRKDMRNRCWAREWKRYFNTRFKLLRQNASGEKYRKPAKIGQNQPFWTKWWVSREIRLYEQFQKSLRVECMNEMKHLPWSIPKTHTRLLRINWNKTTFKIHVFGRIPICRVLSKEKKPCRKSQGLSNSIVIFSVWKIHPWTGKLEQEFHVFCEQAK